jgi:two-component system KDP operon response regulator KdpE
MEGARVLIVEDEPRIVYLVREVLTAAGYEVFAACNGKNAVEQVALHQPHLVILDILLPGGQDGYAVADRLREFSDIPIIMLTGKAREADMLLGFEAGADDYITKPFSSKELLARIKAVLKRSRQGAAQPVSREEIECGDIRIDLRRRKVTNAGLEVHLTSTEYKVLHELAVHQNQVLLHEQLLTAVWGSEYRDDCEYLRSYIHSLRKKLEKNPADPKIIVRCRGVGYCLVCDEAPE